MITIISQTTAEREKEFNELYQKFKEQCYNTNKTVKQIKQDLGIGTGSVNYSKFSKKWNLEEQYTLSQRSTLIQYDKWIGD